MKSKMTKCPICASKNVTKNPEEMSYLRCGNCDIQFRSALEPREIYLERYRKKVFFMRKIVWLLPFSRHYKSQMDFIKPLLKKKGRVLDVGSANGKFLYLLRLRGWKVGGVEPNKQYGGFARDYLNINTFLGFFEDYPIPSYKKGRLDLITMMTVLEHMENPKSALEKARILLSENGRLFVTVPTGIYHKFHNFLFSRKSISYLLEKTGFEVEKIEVEGNPQVSYLIAKLKK